MLKQKLYSIYDSVGGMFVPPFTARNEADAVRMFRTSVNDPSTNLNKYPTDFFLMELGEMDMTTGDIKSDKARKICMGAELLSRSDNINGQLDIEDINLGANNER